MRCAVVGSPIGHSLSPSIHRAAYQALELDWTFHAHDVTESDFAQFLESLGATWRGLSITMPLKRVALEAAASASDLAHTVGAANTLVRDDDGWHADNTDVPGAIAALAERRVRRPSHVCLWGGGATAASFLAALALIEAGPTHVHVRSVERSRPALAIAAALGHPASPAPWAVGTECATADLVVNTVPSQAIEALAGDVAQVVQPTAALFDASYHPWPTALAVRWSGTVVSGLDLLVHQAAGQVRLMTGREVGADVLRGGAEAVLAERAAT